MRIGIFDELAKLQRSSALAVRSLWLHKLRAFLSVLGIIIGTGSVIALMAFGEGSMQDALDDIKRQGATNIIVRSVKPPDDANSSRRSFVAVYGLLPPDYERFSTLPDVYRRVPMRVFPQEIRHLDRSFQARLVGTTEEYRRINKFEMSVGRFLVDGQDQVDDTDDKRFRTVVVLGARVAEELPQAEPRNAVGWYEAAGALACCVSLAAKDATQTLEQRDRLARDYADRAMRTAARAERN